MRVAIDTSPLQDGHRVRGVGVYTKLLIESLQKYEPKHSYHFFTQGQKVPKNVDLVHYPYFDPFFLTLPLFKSKPTVVTIHDLIPIAYPDKFPRGIRGEVKWQIQRLSLRGVKMIITDSQASKGDIHKFSGIRKKNIGVVYLAPAELFQPITDARLLDKIRKRYNLPGPYLLYVGDVNWNKNVAGLLRSFAAIKPSQTPKDLRLVLVGKAFTDDTITETVQLNTLLTKLDLRDRVVRSGYVPEEDLAALYSTACVYVQPSFAEGFGLPILEAMACGCPVIAANASSLAEIAGPAIQVDPHNFSKITQKILEVLHWDTATDRDARGKSLQWASRFSWRKVAAETAAVYEKVVARK